MGGGGRRRSQGGGLRHAGAAARLQSGLAPGARGLARTPPPRAKKVSGPGGGGGRDRGWYRSSPGPPRPDASSRDAEETAREPGAAVLLGFLWKGLESQAPLLRAREPPRQARDAGPVPSSAPRPLRPRECGVWQEPPQSSDEPTVRPAAAWASSRAGEPQLGGQQAGAASAVPPEASQGLPRPAGEGLRQEEPGHWGHSNASAGRGSSEESGWPGTEARAGGYPAART